jgi:hypothetical protein
MNATLEIVAELRERGVRARPRRSGGVLLVPAHLIDPALRDRIYAHKYELIAELRAQQQDAEIDRLAHADAWKPLPRPGHPAWSIIETCHAHGVALRIDPENGDLVVGRAGAKAAELSQPWTLLLIAIEANLEAVARLVESGWHLRVDFPAHASPSQ